jgi:glycerol-1-phosphatase
VHGCPEPLAAAYDLAMLDLDGVVYVGHEAVPGVAQHLEAARGAGMQLAFVTNNAARPPEVVSAHLCDLGVMADASDVVTSAQAAARLVAQEVPSGAHVFVIGGTGLEQALREHGLVAVQSVDADPMAVVSGYHPDLRWRTVIEGAILVGRGLPWVASNTDRSVPTPHGPGPGNGVLVQAVADFTGRTPVVAGKPEPPLFLETRRRAGGQRPLVVGDRLDTDIEGAQRAGFDSLLVLTGVTGLAELVAARPEERPTYVAPTLAALTESQPDVRRDGDDVVVGGWTARVVDGRLLVDGTGSAADWWRAVAAAAWDHLDAAGAPARVTGLDPPTS